MITSPGTQARDTFAAICDENENLTRAQERTSTAVRKMVLAYLTENPATPLGALSNALNAAAACVWQAESRLVPTGEPLMGCSPQMGNAKANR